MKKQISMLLSCFATIAIMTISHDTNAASANVKNKAGTEFSVSSYDVPVMETVMICNNDFAGLAFCEYVITEMNFRLNAIEILSRFELEQDVSYLIQYADKNEIGFVFKDDPGNFINYKNILPIKQFDLVSNPKRTKFLHYSMAYSC